VLLRNGNYLTGDIVALEYGTLTLKTDQMSTLRIEWPAVRSISSKFAFAVERIGGAKYYGVIATDSADDTLVVRTIVADGLAAGNIGSWPENGQQLLGYWVGREWWGRGVATQALALLVDEVSIRPLYAHVAVHNVGSIRVLEKCGFRRDHVQEAKAPAPDDGIEEFIFVLNA
jgi:RimJ/RimL family protein N-acetyltransferase